METSQLKFVLEEVRFSAALPAAILEQIAEESALRKFVANECVFQEGKTNHNLYLVRSGRVALEMRVPGRGAVRILTVGPGEMVGWSALLGNGEMTATAVAVETVEAVVAPADRLQELCRINSDFGYHLMRQMADALSKRLVATRLQLLDLFADRPSNPESEHTV
jgi:CRP-like cAMP-binding protein